MWMVVNNTIFSDLTVVEEVVDTSILTLKDMIDARCGSETVIIKVWLIFYQNFHVSILIHHCISL